MTLIGANSKKGTEGGREGGVGRGMRAMLGLVRMSG